MKTTQQLFENYSIIPVKTRRTERGDLIDFFLEKMNASRREGGYKEWTRSSIGYFLAPYSTENLYQLRSKCEGSKNFGATFNYYVFPKK